MFTVPIARLAKRFTAFRVTQDEFDFVDNRAREMGYGSGPSKGHSMVLREAISALKEKFDKEAKKSKKESDK